MTSMASATPSLPRVLVLYGSETGTAQDVAEQIHQQALNRNLADTQYCALDDFPVGSRLPDCSIVVFVVSTTGDGDTPANMRTAWRSLLRKTLTSTWLSGVRIAVFGLGDSSYAKYNAVARKLHARLLQLGATELIERGLGDDQHALGFFGALNPWLDKLWTAVLQQYPLPSGFVVDDAPRPIEPRYSVTVGGGGSSQASTGFCAYPAPVDALHRDVGVYHARLVENTRITADDWTQDVRHLVFDLGPNSITYPAGAIAVVYPQNVLGVDELVQYVGLPGDTVVTIQPTEADTDTVDLPPSATIHELFSKYLDIQGTPRRSFFARLSLFASDQEEKEKLEEIASPEGADLLYDYCIREKKTYVEVLLDFPSVQLPLAMLIQFIPRLKPRAYSISSSSLAFPGQVHLTVAVVDFLTPYKRRRTGVCSSYFTSLDPASTEIYVPMWIKSGLFNPPDVAQNLIMIGPGTGLAVMRAIAQERQVKRTQHEPASLGKTLLYFGSRHEHKDFLYGDELKKMVSTGALTALHTAFSRDQKHKVYVQTRLAESKEVVFELLTNGAYVYVSGSAKRMPSDVYEVLRDILRSVGKMTLQEAENAMKALVRTKRYVVESWS